MVIIFTDMSPSVRNATPTTARFFSVLAFCGRRRSARCSISGHRVVISGDGRELECSPFGRKTYFASHLVVCGRCLLGEKKSEFEEESIAKTTTAT